jgi:hypothetical protein
MNTKHEPGTYTIPILRPLCPVPFASADTDLDPATLADHCPDCLNLLIDCLCEEGEK